MTQNDPLTLQKTPFLIVAFAIFMTVKLINRLKREEAAAPPAPPGPSEEVMLLREIRDALKK